MARRNLLRTLLSASLLLGSVVTGILAAPLPAGAVPPGFVPDHVVIVHETYFESAWGGQPGEPTKVYAHPNETIEFVLAPGVGPHHSVRLDLDCRRLLSGQCERAFDDPNASKEHPVVWSFQDPMPPVPFFDRYAREEHNFEMTGQFIITNDDLPDPVSPTTTTTVGPTTTTTTRPATTTTTIATTTTTAPGTVRPLLISDPEPTTTTTVAPGPTMNAPVAPAPNKDKDKGKNDKTKVKAAGIETPSTGSAAPTVIPDNVILDATTLTPGPGMVPDSSTGDDADEAAIDAAPVVGLLDHVEKTGDEGARLLQLALAAAMCLLLACGIWGWHNRASRYDPA